MQGVAVDYRTNRIYCIGTSLPGPVIKCNRYMGDITIMDRTIIARIFHYVEGTVIPIKVLDHKTWYRCELPGPATKRERPSMNEFVKDLIDNSSIYRHEYEVKHGINRWATPVSPALNDDSSDDSDNDSDHDNRPKAKISKVSNEVEKKNDKVDETNDVTVGNNEKDGNVENSGKENDKKEDDNKVESGATIQESVLNLPIVCEYEESDPSKIISDPLPSNTVQDNVLNPGVLDFGVLDFGGFSHQGMNNIHTSSTSSNYSIDVNQPSTSNAYSFHSLEPSTSPNHVVDLNQPSTSSNHVVAMPSTIDQPTTPNNSSAGNNQSKPQANCREADELEPSNIDFTDINEEMWFFLYKELEKSKSELSTDSNEVDSNVADNSTIEKPTDSNETE